MAEPVRILIMRRDDLTPEEQQKLEACYFQGTTFVYQHAAPQSSEQWLMECRIFKADVVVLPSEEPLPMPAMREGFPHVSFTPQGIVRVTDVEVTRIPFII